MNDAPVQPLTAPSFHLHLSQRPDGHALRQRGDGVKKRGAPHQGHAGDGTTGAAPKGPQYLSINLGSCPALEESSSGLPPGNHNGRRCPPDATTKADTRVSDWPSLTRSKVPRLRQGQTPEAKHLFEESKEVRIRQRGNAAGILWQYGMEIGRAHV